MPYDLTTVLQFVAGGVSLGLVYSLIALGFTMIFNASGILNFAQGSFVMLGGMLTYALFSLGVPLVLAALLAICGTALVALVAYRVVVWPIQRRHGPLHVIIVALFGLHIVLENAALLTMGSSGVGYPPFVAGPPVEFGGVVMSQSMLVIGTGAVLVMACLNFFFLRTSLGHAMRAAAINQTAARLVGIRVERMVLLAFAFSGVLGAIAGVLVTPAQFTAFDVGIAFAVKGFAAAVLGGFGNIYGAMLGGVLIGVVEALGVAFISTDYKDATTFAVMLLILMARPQGLLGSLVEDEEYDR